MDFFLGRGAGKAPHVLLLGSAIQWLAHAEDPILLNTGIRPAVVLWPKWWHKIPLSKQLQDAGENDNLYITEVMDLKSYKSLKLSGNVFVAKEEYPSELPKWNAWKKVRVAWSHFECIYPITISFKKNIFPLNWLEINYQEFWLMHNNKHKTHNNKDSWALQNLE